MNSRFFKLAHDMLCITTTDGTYLHVNPAWMRVLGWPAEQVQGRSFREFMHADDAHLVAELLPSIIGSGFLESHRVRMRTADGSYRIIDFRTTYDPAGDELLAAGRDVTEEVVMQRHLVAREQKLADVVAHQTRECEEKIARLGADLHDTAVQHNVAALMFLDTASYDDPPPMIADAANQVRLSLDALRRIMAGLDAVEADVHDMRVGFRAIVDAVAVQFSAAIDCAVDGPRALPEALRRTAYYVVREGLVNACKHADSGPIHLAVNADSDVLRIRIQDPGSAQRNGSDHSHGDSDGGLGRGLVLLDARVRSHGGELDLTTSADCSTLTAVIPLRGRDPDDPHGGFTPPGNVAMSEA